MTPSQRIDHIEEIAWRLDRQEWGGIDLVLREFNLPSFAKDWTRLSIDYIREVARKASDDVLVDLAKHLGYSAEITSLSEEPDFWEPNQFRLFISHLSEEQKWASLLEKRLSKFGICGFVAHVDIEPTKKWQEEIRKALLSMDAIVALYHKGFELSAWTDQEIGAAVGRDVLMIPVKFDMDPYGFIGSQQAIEGRGKSEYEVAEEIFESLLLEPKTRGRINECVVAQFADSSSYNEVRSNVALLEKCRDLTPELRAKIERAISENGEIKDTRGVDYKLRALVSGPV